MTGPFRLRNPSQASGAAPRRSVHSKLNNGFTLLEVMVVLVIIGLLTGLSVPRFLRSNAEAQLEGDAQRMLLDFRIAKQAANKTGIRHFIRIIPPGKLEIWRDKNTDLTFTAADDSMIFQDDLNPKDIFGFTSTLLNTVATAPVGFEAPSTISSADKGLGQSINPTEDCVDLVSYPLTPASTTALGWNSTTEGSNFVIPACGSAIADMAEGIVYLSSSGSDEKMYAIGYQSQSIQLHLFRYSRGANLWEEP